MLYLHQHSYDEVYHSKLSNQFLIADPNLFFPFFAKIYFFVPHHKYPVNPTQHMQSFAFYSTVFIRTYNETEYAACNCCFYQICLPFLHPTNSSKLITTNNSFRCNLFSPFYDYTQNYGLSVVLPTAKYSFPTVRICLHHLF